MSEPTRVKNHSVATFVTRLSFPLPTFDGTDHLPTAKAGEEPDRQSDGADTGEEVAEVVLDHVKGVLEHLASIICMRA